MADRIQQYYRELRVQKPEEPWPSFHRTGWDWNVVIDPEIYEKPRYSPALHAHRPEPARVSKLEQGLKSLKYFEKPQKRRALLRVLPRSLAEGIVADEPARFFPQLAEKILGAPDDLGRVLEAFDQLPGLRDVPEIGDHLYAILDRLDRRVISNGDRSFVRCVRASPAARGEK